MLSFFFRSLLLELSFKKTDKYFNRSIENDPLDLFSYQNFLILVSV